MLTGCSFRLLADRAEAAIKTDWDKTVDLGDQLDVIFRHMAVEPYDLLRASPNAEDIIAGFNAASQKELAAAAEYNRVLIARVLAPSKPAIEQTGLTLDDFADFVQRSATAAKHNATSRKHLLKLLGALKIAALKVAEPA